MAQVPEGRRIFPRMSVFENLQMGAIVADPAHFQHDLDRVFAMFPRLAERREQRGGTLSGGEQQMLAIGRALMSRPRLLLLDEPSLGLAPLIVRQIFEAIGRIAREEGVTIFLVEQNAFHALRLADRGYVLVNGRVRLSGTGRELLANPRSAPPISKAATHEPVRHLHVRLVRRHAVHRAAVQFRAGRGRRRSPPARAWRSPGGRGGSSCSIRRCCRLGLRFFDYALAGGELWSIGGFLLGWVVQFAIAAFAYRLTRVRQMVRQYPWLYRAQRLAGLGGAALSSTPELHVVEGNQGRPCMSRLFGTLAVAALALAATPAFAQIKIASVGPMTGQYAAFGEQIASAARRWRSRTSTPPAASTARSSSCRSATMPAIPSRRPRSPTSWSSDKVVFVAGHYCSGSSIPASDIYKEAKILQITPASTNIKLTDDAAAKGNTTVFRTCGRDDVQGATVGAYIIKNNKNAKVAILHDKSPYGKGVADETKKALNEGRPEGGHVRGLQRHRQGLHRADQQDEAGQDRHHRARRLPHRGRAMLIKQSREQGFGAQMVGFDALEDAEFGKLGGAATDGVLMSFPPKAEDDPKNAALVKKFRDAKYDPAGYTLFTYAAVKVWADAANKAKSTDAAAIATALRSGTFQSAVGPLTYDAKGDIKDPVYDIYIWKDGKSTPTGKK